MSAHPVSSEACREGVVGDGAVVGNGINVSGTVSGIVVGIDIGMAVIISLTGLSVGVIIIGPGAFLV